MKRLIGLLAMIILAACSDTAPPTPAMPEPTVAARAVQSIPTTEPTGAPPLTYASPLFPMPYLPAGSAQAEFLGAGRFLADSPPGQERSSPSFSRNRSYRRAQPAGDRLSRGLASPRRRGRDAA